MFTSKSRRILSCRRCGYSVDVHRSVFDAWCVNHADTVEMTETRREKKSAVEAA